MRYVDVIGYVSYQNEHVFEWYMGRCASMNIDTSQIHVFDREIRLLPFSIS